MACIDFNVASRFTGNNERTTYNNKNDEILILYEFSKAAQLINEL